jgi:predicted RNA binding protein YcfA (HicA-like mRNA interferase family)
MLGKRTSQIPRHPSTEIRTGTFQTILKQLGLKK